jgi:hypothetical protein
MNSRQSRFVADSFAACSDPRTAPTHPNLRFAKNFDPKRRVRRLVACLLGTGSPCVRSMRSPEPHPDTMRG